MAQIEKGFDRRRFLAAIGLGGAAAGAAATAAVVAPTAADAGETQDEKTKARYRVTEDVKNFYRVNRY